MHTSFENIVIIIIQLKGDKSKHNLLFTILCECDILILNISQKGKNMKEYLECGKIVNTHGVRGGVIIESWCDTPEVLSKLKTVYTEKNGAYLPVELVKASVYKGRVLAEMHGVDTLEKAMMFKNTVLYAARGDLPLADGDFFVQDLIGLPVYEYGTDEKHGTLTDVISGAASDLYEIENERGKFLVPVVAEFVKEIDLERGIFIKSIEGMFE